jgi:hypothetical protein
MLPLVTRDEQGDHFPGIFRHHIMPLVACGASYLPFAKVGLFLKFRHNLYKYLEALQQKYHGLCSNEKVVNIVLF